MVRWAKIDGRGDKDRPSQYGVGSLSGQRCKCGECGHMSYSWSQKSLYGGKSKRSTVSMWSDQANLDLVNVSKI